MFGKRWRLFQILRFPVSIDASWLIVLFLLTLSLAEGFPAMLEQYFPTAAPLRSPVAYWVMGLITALAFFGCILLHEFGHAVVARARGLRIGGITLFLFGGVAELRDEPDSPGTEFLMAIAGPLVSGALAIVLWIAAVAGYNGGWPYPLVIVLGYLAIINAVVLLFNLVPAFPLDGGRVLRSILWGATGNLRAATRWASYAGRAFAWLLIVSGLLQLFSHDWVAGMWSVLIGMFLDSAARGAYQQVLVQQALRGEPVRRFMNAQPVVVPPTLDVAHWVDDFVYRYHHRAFPVAANGHLEGFITTQALSQLPRAEWGAHTVGELMTRDVAAMSIAADADAVDALARMQRLGVSRLLVTAADKLLGIVSLKDLLRFLDLKLELEDHNDAVSQRDGAADINAPVAVYTTTNLAEAEIVKNAIESKGIQCGLDAENQGGFAGVFAVKVLVRAWDEELARQVLARHAHHHPEQGHVESLV
ncbi:MAG TPA: site-2 protease family protein [Pirellulales bacterium]|jgi:Zn-dependent protease/CBS domain-containing protein|nr:site-2 protease family protein [Pirellulales bacterium]